MLHGVWTDEGGISAEFFLDPESICGCMLDEVEDRAYERIAGYVRSRSTQHKWKAIQWSRKNAEMLVLDRGMTEALSALTGDSTRVVGELVNLEPEEQSD